MTHKADAKTAINRAVRGVINALSASMNAQTVKRFVYTSSPFAVTQPKPGRSFSVNQKIFNEEAVQRAAQPDADGETIYSASKVEAERAISAWVK